MSLNQIIYYNNNIVIINNKYNLFSSMCMFKKLCAISLALVYSPDTTFPMWIFQTMLEGTALVHIRPSSIDVLVGSTRETITRWNLHIHFILQVSMQEKKCLIKFLHNSNITHLFHKYTHLLVINVIYLS